MTDERVSFARTHPPPPTGGPARSSSTLIKLARHHKMDKNTRPKRLAPETLAITTARPPPAELVLTSGAPALNEIDEARR